MYILQDEVNIPLIDDTNSIEDDQDSEKVNKNTLPDTELELVHKIDDEQGEDTEAELPTTRGTHNLVDLKVFTGSTWSTQVDQVDFVQRYRST